MSTLTRPRRDFELVRFYVDWGLNNCQIERLSGVPRATIRTWRQRAAEGLHNASKQGGGESACPFCGKTRLNGRSYSYLLGVYLGDGCLIALRKGVYKLCVVQDERYIGLISECNDAISSLLLGHSLHVGFQQLEGCILIGSMWKHWPCLFPQHGRGPKHLRPIRLAGWQDSIVSQYFGEFIRGLIHSDGYRGWNRVRRPVGDGIKEYAYMRYQFTNESEDIRTLFCRSLDRMGVAWRRMNRKTISIARRAEVEKLDLIVGPKY